MNSPTPAKKALRKKAVKLSPLPSQLTLFSAVCKCFGSRPANPRQLNAIIRACDSILAEFARPEAKSVAGMGYEAWKASDDTGMSSKYLAYILSGDWTSAEGRDRKTLSYPHDPDDFGRCYRMLRACPEFKISSAADMVVRTEQMEKPWPQLGAAWPELEALYEKELPNGEAPLLYQRMKEIITAAGLWEGASRG